MKKVETDAKIVSFTTEEDVSSNANDKVLKFRADLFVNSEIPAVS